MPIFPGVGGVINLVRELIRRPRFGEAPFGARLGRRRAGRMGIPMVCLVRDGTQQLLPAIATEYLDRARPGRIPHALHQFTPQLRPDLAPGEDVPPPTAKDVDNIREILYGISRELFSGRNSRYGRIRFRHFGLLYWLMGQSLGSEVKDPDRVLRERLRERDIVVRPDERILTATTETLAEVTRITPWVRRLLTLIPPLWFAVKVSGRIPILSTPYRWFLRQPNLAPQDPGTFVGFAERLTKDGYGKENPDQMLRLLVNSFLEDLRRAYGRWPWRLAGARRMTYAVVLLDGITRANGGYRLLKLINDVRNETGAFDPLLVVSGSEKVPPYAVDPRRSNPEVGVWDAANAGRGYEAWRNRFSSNSRSRTPTAWYLLIRIPPAIPEPGRVPAEAREVRLRYVRAAQELDVLEGFTIDRPPLLSSRWVPGWAAVTLIGVLAFAGFDYREQHCGALPGAVGAEWFMSVGEECIGVSDGSHVFEPTNGRLADVERKVHELNVEAVKQHAASPSRPYVTLVYVAALTSAAHPVSELVTARERLEGVAIAQARQLALSGANEPIVRVLIANGGTSMAHGTDMARTVVRMAAGDSSIVGVVGLDQSRKPTFDAIDILSQAGLPIVAATLSADNLVEASPLYFQVSPQNIREAAVAAGYARATFGSTHLRILASADPTDTYSANLTRDVRKSFADAGFAVDPVVNFTPQGLPGTDPSAASVAEDACRYDGLLFFTGRQEDFEELLRGFFAHCKDHPPRIIGDDDTARYVADSTKRTQNPEIPYAFMSFAIGPRSCTNDAVYNELDRLFKDECGADRDSSLDGSMELAYDATFAMINAATHLRQDHQIPVTAGGVWHELSTLQLDGESGRIAFGSTPTARVPADKSIAVLRVERGQPPQLQGLCGVHADLQPASWCPPTERSGQSGGSG